jgi:hypothetical protein
MEPTLKWLILYSLYLSSTKKQLGCSKKYESLENEGTLEN